MSLTTFLILSLLTLFFIGLVVYFAFQLRLVFSSLLFFIFIILIRSGVFIVTEGSQAVITEFGAVVGSAYTNPGIYFKVPFLWKVNYFDKRIYREGAFQTEIPTNDGYFIKLDEVFNWRISDPALFIQTMDSVDAARTFIRNNVLGGFKQVISKNNLVDIIRSSDRVMMVDSYFNIKELEAAIDDDGVLSDIIGRGQQVNLGRSKLSELIKKEMVNYTHDFGIEVVGVFIRNITYEVAVEERIHQRMVMERLREAARLYALGRSEAQKIRGFTGLKYQTIVGPAQHEAHRIKGEADAVAAQLYAQAYSKDPDFYQYWRTLGAYSKTLPNMSQGMILSTDVPFLKLIREGETKSKVVDDISFKSKEGSKEVGS